MTLTSTSLGIEYYDDINCVIRKYHSSGIRNIYIVNVDVCDDVTPGQESTISTIKFVYGCFDMAMCRFAFERDSGNSASIRLATVNDTNVVLSERLLDYNSFNYHNDHNDLDIHLSYQDIMVNNKVYINND